MILAVLMALALGSKPNATVVTVDRLEINHVYDEHTDSTGVYSLKPRLTQVVFWKWSRVHRKWISQGYTMVKHPWDYPRRDVARDIYWVKAVKMGKPYIVQAAIVTESKTLYDPEADDRKFNPQFEREMLR